MKKLFLIGIIVVIGYVGFNYVKAHLKLAPTTTETTQPPATTQVPSLLNQMQSLESQMQMIKAQLDLIQAEIESK